jgi:flagellar basal-body rod modification protein FlgD
MEPINATLPTGVGESTGAGAPKSFAELGGAEFLRLLIVQLRNQDPLEPMDNAQMLQQIASVRDIELSTTLTDSLRMLTGQQRFASASSLIGQHVTSEPADDGTVQRGVVVGVRFTEGGRPILQLSDGSEMPLDEVMMIQPPLRAAEAMVGLKVIGVDRRDPANTEVIDGVVTGARLDDQQEVVLELDTGQDLRFRDVVSVTSQEE